MLTREMLRRMAGDTIYLRGEELYENGSVKSLRLENGQFCDGVRAKVQGSGNLRYNVCVIYGWEYDYIEEYSCECAAYRNYEGMCKHCVAAALGYIDSLENRTIAERLQSAGKEEILRPFVWGSEGKSPGRGLPLTSPALTKLLQRRVLHRTLPLTDTVYYGRVALEPKLTQSNREMKLGFSIGAAGGHKYVVKDILTLARALEQNEAFSYGRNLTFVHTREAFEEESRGLVDFVLDWTQANKSRYVQSYSSYGYFSRPYTARLKEISLTDGELEDFINAMGGRPFQGSLEGQTGQWWQETEEKLPRILKIRGRDMGLEIAVNLGEVHRGKRDNFYFRDGWIYRVSRREEGPVQDFLDCFRDMSEGSSLFVAAKDVPVFCREVLPALEGCFTPDYHSFDKADYGVKEVSFRIYLDAPEKDYYTCRLYAVYGEQRFDLFKGVEIDTDRDTVREIQTGQQVRRYFNGYNETSGEMTLRGDDDMAYELLTRGISEFQTLGEVFVSEALKLVKISPSPRPAVGVSLSGDLLELQITAGDLSMEQLLEILGKYNRKKRFYRLKSGEFVNMEGEAIGALLELKEGLGISAGQIGSGKIQLPKYRALYLDGETREWASLKLEKNREFKALIRSMKTVEDNDFELPESLEGVLREYQRKGFFWLGTLKQNGFGGILADEMGLGKTLQVITLLLWEAMENPEGKHPLALVVCPASLVYNWSSEINRFAPGLSVKMVAGNAQERQSLLNGDCGAGDILITSYDLLKRDLEFYKSLHFEVQIIDEAQYIKNFNTQAARSVKEISAGFKLALTGTPIENRLSELWSIFDYLMPGYLYSYHRFQDSFETPIVQEQDETVRKRLQKMIKPFVLRRLKKDVLTDLPDKLEENLYARLEGEQQSLYDAHVKRLLMTVDKESEEEFRKGKIQILAELTKLRQLCCDPGLLYENYQGESAKLQLCLDIVKNAVNGGHKILLFSQFTTMLERICGELGREDISFYVLTGATGKEERRRLVESFQSDDTNVFCISLRAGGTGLNLTAADIVIHYDPWWNVAVQNQATDRTHRIGQENIVSVYRLIAKDTIEEKIMCLQEKKRELADQLLNAEEIGSGSFSREELLELLQR